MAINFLKQRHHKIIAGVTGGVLVIILVLSILINQYWSPILAKKVKDVVLTSSNGLYKADFSDAELHILRGSIVFYNITLTPDTAVYNQRLKMHLAPNNLITVHVKKLVLMHIHPFLLYFQHKLDISEIILSNPELDVSYRLNHTRDTVIKDNRTVWQKISKTLHSVHIGQIFLNDVQLKYSDYSGHKVEISKLKEMNLGAGDLLIDSATQTDKTRILFCRDIVTELNNYKGISESGLYSYEIKHLKLSTLTSDLEIEGLTLKPVNKGKFFDASDKDRFTVQLDSVRLNHFDYLSYHKYRKVSISNMVVSHGSFDLFNNPKSSKIPKSDRAQSFPSAVLRRFATQLRIDTLSVKDINVSYSEYNTKSYQSGSIRFNSTYGKLLNITNDSLALTKNNMCTINLHTLFMNEGKLDVHFNFDLTSKNLAYDYKAHLGPMNLEAVNPATMPFAMVKITDGRVKSLDFDIKANSQTNRGRVTLLYNDLKVKLLSPDTAMYGFKGKIIESLYANIFIIKHDNPDKPGETPRSFYVNYIRPKDSPFFKTVWNTILTGIKPAAGLDDKKMQATKVQMTNHQLNKQKRLIKRAERRARRAVKEQQKAKDNKLLQQ
jgi:hypothetical protein